jgi:hypothetical protein
MKFLIYDLLLTEAWKDKVYPVLKPSLAKVSSIRSYMAVSVLVNSPKCRFTTKPQSSTF